MNENPGNVATEVRHAGNKTLLHRIDNDHDDNRDGARGPLNGGNHETSISKDDIWCKPYQFGSKSLTRPASPPDQRNSIFRLRPSVQPGSCNAWRNTEMRDCSRRVAHQHADPPHAVALPRPRGEGPRRRWSDQCDELAPPCMPGKQHTEG